jgi:AcrR family transcriptional regulator
MPRRTADEASKTRSAILDAALLVFAERGVHAAQLEEVARRAGVTRGALYHHFDGKPALLLSVLAERWSSTMEPVLEPLRAGGGEVAIRGFVERFLEHADSDPMVRALLRLSLSGELASVEAEGLPEKARAFEEWLALLDANIAAIRGSRNVRVLSEGVLHALVGYAVWTSLFGPAKTRCYGVRSAQILRGISK